MEDGSGEQLCAATCTLKNLTPPVLLETLYFAVTDPLKTRPAVSMNKVSTLKKPSCKQVRFNNT